MLLKRTMPITFELSHVQYFIFRGITRIKVFDIRMTKRVIYRRWNAKISLKIIFILWLVVVVVVVVNVVNVDFIVVVVVDVVVVVVVVQNKGRRERLKTTETGQNSGKRKFLSGMIN